jgi:hypothetical protein
VRFLTSVHTPKVSVPLPGANVVHRSLCASNFQGAVYREPHACLSLLQIVNLVEEQGLQGIAAKISTELITVSGDNW